MFIYGPQDLLWADCKLCFIFLLARDWIYFQHWGQMSFQHIFNCVWIPGWKKWCVWLHVGIKIFNHLLFNLPEASMVIWTSTFFVKFLLGLLSGLLFLLSLDCLMSFNKWFLDFFFCGSISLSPGVREYLHQRWSMNWIVLHHHLNQLFEILRIVFSSSSFTIWVLFPENVCSVSGQTFIERVLHISITHRRMSGNQNK